MADNNCICTEEVRIDVLEREIAMLNNKVWRGGNGGKPPLTEQLAVQQQAIRALCWLVAITCTAVVAQIVAMVFSRAG